MKEVFIVPKWVGFAFLLVIGGICTSAYFRELRDIRHSIFNNQNT